jgi:hypothetical protein
MRSHYECHPARLSPKNPFPRSRVKADCAAPIESSLRARLKYLSNDSCTDSSEIVVWRSKTAMIAMCTSAPGSSLSLCRRGAPNDCDSPMPIQRSWSRTMAWTCVVLVLLCMAGFMVYSGEYLVAGALALLGLASMVGIGSGSYMMHCPVCDQELRGLIGLKRCPKCLSYEKVSVGEYYELQPDCVTEVPLLALPLGDRRDAADLLCLCPFTRGRRQPLPWAYCSFGKLNLFLRSVPCGSRKAGWKPCFSVFSFCCRFALACCFVLSCGGVDG